MEYEGKYKIFYENSFEIKQEMFKDFFFPELNVGRLKWYL